MRAFLDSLFREPRRRVASKRGGFSLETLMPSVKMKSGKTKKFPYTKKGMAAAKKAAGKKGSRMASKRGKSSYG